MKTEFYESAEVSDVGKKRKNNEDACLRIPDRGVFCVADGMGGQAGGDLASEAIVTALQEVFSKAPPAPDETLDGLEDRRGVVQGHRQPQGASGSLRFAQVHRARARGEVVVHRSHLHHSKDDAVTGHGPPQFPKRRDTDSTTPPAE